jgi:hypothetical protein
MILFCFFLFDFVNLEDEKWLKVLSNLLVQTAEK